MTTKEEPWDELCPGNELDDCWRCGGDGYVMLECFEDTCCCENGEFDHDWMECPTCCGGKE